MTNLTLAIPEDIKEEMKKFPEINWSVIAREAIQKRIILLNKFREITEGSALTEEDAIELGKKIKKGRFNKLRSKGLV
ncbi:MAG: hypothetical protein AABX96_01645 [Nanoarchaeota archaeon]